MARVLLLATTTGYQIRAFGEAAERLGVDLVFATDRCHMLDDPWMDRAVPVRFHDERSSVTAVLEAARSRPIDGVLAVGDQPTVVAALVNEALGLPGHPSFAAAAARNKLATRERLRSAGLAVPAFAQYSLSVDPHLLASSVTFPAVVKPLALSGSRGVMRVNDQEEMVTAYYRLRSLLQSADVRAEHNSAHEFVLVEEFIPGREFAIEGVMNHGSLHVLAVFDKPDPLDGPFFEETIYVTPSRLLQSEQRLLTNTIARATGALGLRHGPIHAECRINERGAFVLEVAARPIGGLCARALRFVQSADPIVEVSLEELLLRHALGEWSTTWRREHLASGVMMIPIPRRGVFRGVSGLDGARSVPGISDVRLTAKNDQVLVPLPEGASYLGFIFARGTLPDDVEFALRSAHTRLRFDIDPEVPVLQSLHG
jgi:biotin carboxylase